MFQVFADFQQSGETRLAYCEKNNLALAKFNYWQKKFRAQTSNTPNGFIHISARKGHGAIEPMVPIVLQYPNGVSLQLPAGTPIATLRTLLNLA